MESRTYDQLVLDQQFATEFAKRHIYDCVVELLHWQDTALLLNDGRVRELATLCTWAPTGQQLTAAESLIRRVALESLIKHIDFHRAT